MLRNKLTLLLACVSFIALSTTGCMPNQDETTQPEEQQMESPVAPTVEEEEESMEEESAETEETMEEETEQ